jgi:hypothetical protein
MAELDKWDSFYVITGSAAGALIGLQFVVVTLIAERPPSDAVRGSQAFGTPTIVHFSAVLLLCALLRVPWGSFTAVAIACAAIGVCGALYILLTAHRMRATNYAPDREDWLFHVGLPFVAYAGLAAPYWASLSARATTFAVAAATLVLLFAGIHNAWDAVSYHVLVTRRPKNPDTQSKR